METSEQCVKSAPSEQKYQNDVSYIVLIRFSLWADLTHCSRVSIVVFKQVNVGWVVAYLNSTSFYRDNLGHAEHVQLMFLLLTSNILCVWLPGAALLVIKFDNYVLVLTVFVDWRIGNDTF